MNASAASDVASAKSTAPAKAAQKTDAAAPQQVNPAWQLFALGAQAKLSVSAPDDPGEREADHVADRVMRMPEPTVQRKCAACGSSPTPCANCEAEKKLQRKAESAASPPASVAAPSLGGGAPLDAGARSFFEPRFNNSFEHVRVHTDSAAAQAAEAMGARAFTLGSDIGFGSGQYQPGTDEGQRLLAHELTHVLQQGPASQVRAKHADDAEGNLGGDLTITRGMEPAIQRQCVAGLIPQLRCCLPGKSWSVVGNRAHQKLQTGAGLLIPGTIGEAAIPPAFPFRWHYADLYRSDPAIPVTAPDRTGAPYSGLHREINPYGLPITRVPPATPASGAAIGEIKPLSHYGLARGPADLARNMLHYDAWAGSFSASQWSALPVIPGGPFGSPFNLLVAFQPAVPGAYNYCCFDARRVARAVARALQRAWEALKELFHQLLEWLAENWEVILIILLVIIAIILIIAFWADIIAAALALGRALLAFLAWLLSILRAIPRIPRPIPPEIGVPPVRPPPIEYPLPPVRPPIEYPLPPVRPPIEYPVPPWQPPLRPLPPRPPLWPPARPFPPLRPPVRPPAELPHAAGLVVPMQNFVSSHMVATADAAGGDEAPPDEEVDGAPESVASEDPTVAPSLPIEAPPGFDALGEEAAAQVDELFGGVIDSLREMVPGLQSSSPDVSGVGDTLLAGAPGMLAPLMQHMGGDGMPSEARAMIGDFLARAPGARPPSGPETPGGDAPLV